MTARKILLVEDNDLLCASLQKMLMASDFKVQTFSTAQAFVEYVKDHLDTAANNSTLALMDVNLGSESGIAAQQAIRSTAPDLPVVFMSAYQNARDVNQAWRDGALNFLFKPFTPAELMQAIDSAFENSLKKQTAHFSSVDPETLRKFERLTPRQRQVLKLVAQGFSNTSIAEEIGITPRTVKMHRESIMHRFGFTHVADLIRFHDSCRHLL